MLTHNWEYLIYGFFLYAFLLVTYLQFARKLQLTDIPNNRSSHQAITITGGGFIFPIAFILPLLITGDFIHYRATITGLMILALVSWSDDLKSVHPIVRVSVQVFAVSLLLWQTGGLFRMKPWQVIPGFILVVGIINSYNFMDGINGMNALYSLSIIGLIAVMKWVGNFSRLPDLNVFCSLLGSLLAFSFFNIRKKAFCFSGDVGSISIAYILSLLIIQLMLDTNSAEWILLVGIYGLDSVGTIILRLIRGEKVWLPHRTHFYQFLVNEKRYPHVLVSFIYAISQFILSIILWKGGLFFSLLFYIFLILIYVCTRLTMEGKYRLFNNYFTQTAE
jgi:UDP-N-acetylmuramyl pentapeptide phosphotransferase/UDP-N-acetylglucosamine-1-phosphate transferase